MDIAQNVKTVFERIEAAAIKAGRQPEDISLVAATKTNGRQAIAAALAAGVKICGENRVQELVEKNAQGAYGDSRLHFIGHLQKNKVRQVVGVCQLIQSVDSPELLSLINQRALDLGIVQAVLLEINIGGEQSKTGMAPEELPDILQAAAAFPGVLIRGLMAIPPISVTEGGNRPYFARMYQLYIDISTKKYDNVCMDFLSMGMSGDFEDAIAEGSNMVRVGSAIFGERTYPT